ncbi:phage portal protein [Nocardia higoensis]|uniref:Phage portal protein n=1 Tax=Nocardia higoensis TaxID=228599 RepID=A0ABS0DIA3_9NOCA|nr:phage portal protein [Nocardia higoensis]MBF6358191.1 phage portal protein [Nocardia higoensis]
MPMPVYKGAWPPEPWSTAQASYDLHNAWAAGDTDSLASFYTQYPDGKPPKVRSSQYSSGVIGRLARWFWGRPPQQATKRIHVPAAADVARTSADLLFAQPPTWLLNDGDATNLEAAQTRLEQLLGGPDAIATFLEAAEIQAALGGVFLRLWWDKDATDKVMFSAVSPDAAVPEWRYGRLVAVTFWTIVAEDKQGVWRHLERHEAGRIYHALYKGDGDHIGYEQPLESLDVMKWAADAVDDDQSISTNVDGLTAAYIPNVRPARKWRNVPGLSSLGRSDFEGVEQLFDALDEAYSSWMRDLDLAKARLFVAQQLLDDNGPGQGSSFDPEQAVFTGVPADDVLLNENGPAQLVQAQQFAIRHEEHLATCQTLLNRILVACGYSTGDFGDDQLAGAMTATEVSARKDLSNRTRARKALYWCSGMQPLARTMLALDRVVYPDGESFEVTADPEMVFPVRVDIDPVQQSLTIQNLRSALAMSIEQAVRERNPNWSDPQVEEEVQRIKEENEFSVPDPDGGDFDPAAADQDAHTDFQGEVEPDHEAEAA